MYQYKTPSEIDRERKQDAILFFFMGAALGFALACFIVYLYL